jgi:hypothetical protein
VKWNNDADCEVRDSESQAFVFGFSKSPDILHVSKIPSPFQPLVMDAPSNFRIRAKDDDEDEYKPAHWYVCSSSLHPTSTNSQIRSKQDIDHQRWSFRDGVVKSPGISALDPSFHDTVRFFRRYPHGTRETPDGLLRFMGDKFELMDDELPGSNFPVVWDMQPVKDSILQFRRLFNPPLDEDHFSAHLQQTVLSIPQKAVAIIGAFEKADEEDGSIMFPWTYSHPFICIHKLDNTAALLWQWHGEKPDFNASNLVVSFAFSPDPESGLFAFSTRVAMAEGDGLYVGNHHDGLQTKPRRISSKMTCTCIFRKSADRC